MRSHSGAVFGVVRRGDVENGTGTRAAAGSGGAPGPGAVAVVVRARLRGRVSEPDDAGRWCVIAMACVAVPVIGSMWCCRSGVAVRVRSAGVVLVAWTRKPDDSDEVFLDIDPDRTYVRLMNRDVLLELVERLADVDVAGLDRADAAVVLGELGRLRGWADHLRLGVVARIAELSPTPERDIADADGSSGRDAARDITSAAAVGSDALAGPAESLANGAISRAHLDLLADMLRSLDTPELRERFRAVLPELDALARLTPFDPFARHVRRVVDQLRREAGEERLTRQRRETRLAIRVDRVTGMVDLFGRFDPRSGLALRNRLEEIRDQLAASGYADRPDAPADPLQRPGWLLAQALLHLVNGTAAAPRRPEISIVIDTRTSGASDGCSGADGITGIRAGAAGHSRSAGNPGAARNAGATRSSAVSDTVADGSDAAAGRSGTVADPIADALAAIAVGRAAVDWGLEIDLPVEEITALAQQATVHMIVTDGTRIMTAPGRLDLGRSTRLANADQRRALRAIYPRCAIPDCPAPFERCDVHHVVPWEQGGPTDLANLLPVCAHHHQHLHAHRWKLHLDADRHLTITLPDATTLHAHPPSRHAA